MGDVLEILFLLLVGHAIADFPLQGDWLSKAKNHTLNLVDETIWPVSLATHSLIHAGAVWLVTQSWLLSSCEFVAHALIDFLKCDGKIGYNTDQILHVWCKVIWAGIMFYGLG